MESTIAITEEVLLMLYDQIAAKRWSNTLWPVSGTLSTSGEMVMRHPNYQQYEKLFHALQWGEGGAKL